MKVRLVDGGLAHGSAWHGALGPVLSIQALLGRARFTYLMQPLQRECVWPFSQTGGLWLWGTQEAHLCFDVTLQAYSDPSGRPTSTALPVQSPRAPGGGLGEPQGRHGLRRPGLGSTCRDDDIRLEGSELRGRHSVPVQLCHHHPGALRVVGAVFWVLRRGSDIWLQQETVEKDVPSELLKDVAVTVAEDVCSRTAHPADGHAREAGAAAEL